jgi:exosortase family protein XrtF
MIKQLLQDPKHGAIIRFLVKALSVYIIWFVSYDYFIAPSGIVDAWLNNLLAENASMFLSLFGFAGDTAPGIHQTIVRINGVGMVGVGNPCNGLELFALFAGFIFCFPGPWRKKVVFVLLGIIGIHFVNVLRTILLTLIQFKAPQYLEFNHHYTFTVIVYAFIFYLWIIWVNKISGFNLISKSEKK